MADTIEQREEGGTTPAWATKLQETLDKLTESLSKPLQSQEEEEEVQKVQVPPPPAPAPKPMEKEMEVELEEPTPVENPKQSKGKSFLNWLF